MFNPLTKKIETNKDVVFHEESTWNWNMQQSTPILVDNEVGEVVAILEISEISTLAAVEILPTALEETDATDQPFVMLTEGPRG
uniref:Putative ovule protein n=1 Tax=Solanum chacoense TaxID=4108 RepID=A0A0V0H422_SOLCH